MEQYFETMRVKNVIITGDLRLFCKWFTCISSRTLRPLTRLNTGKKNIGLTDLCDFLCFISLKKMISWKTQI